MLKVIVDPQMNDSHFHGSFFDEKHLAINDVLNNFLPISSNQKETDREFSQR